MSAGSGSELMGGAENWRYLRSDQTLGVGGSEVGTGARQATDPLDIGVALNMIEERPQVQFLTPLDFGEDLGTEMQAL